MLYSIETWELLHQKQSKFAFSEPPLVDDIINIINQSRTRKSLACCPTLIDILDDNKPKH